MSDVEIFASLLADGVLALGSGPRARLAVADSLVPSAVRMLARATSTQRSEYATQLVSLWGAFEQERAGAYGGAWPELTAAFLAVAELARAELPAGAQAASSADGMAHLIATKLERASTYALLAGAQGGAYRVFVDVSELGEICVAELKDGFHETLRYSVVGPSFDGRSHWLSVVLAALRAQRAERWLPIAATGDLLDGRRVGPVEALPEKVRRFFETIASGYVVTPAPDRGATSSLCSLLSEFREGSYGDPDDARLARWVVAGSLEEAEWKLTSVHSERTIESWDGRQLTRGQVVELGLSRKTFSEGDRELPKDLPANLLFRACCQTDLAGKHATRGVIIEGGPGTGKSIFSQQLEQRFLTGLLGTIGSAVRVRARLLARHLARLDIDLGRADLVDCLPRCEAMEAQVVRALGAMDRFWLIVDGLDEVGAVGRRNIGTLFGRKDVRFIATTRPVERMAPNFPAYSTLQLSSFSPDQAAELLKGLDRADLADQLSRDSTQQDPLPDAITDFAGSPFRLSLLAAIIPKGKRLSRYSVHDLYRHAFDAMLQRACADEHVADPDTLRRGAARALGGLAYRELTRTTGGLDDIAIEHALQFMDAGPKQFIAVVRALERGHILVGGPEEWEFGHRTVAEWLAAEHLRREVARAVEDSPDKPADEIEAEIIRPHLAEQDGGRPKNWQMILLYARRARFPETLIRSLMTSSCARDDEYEVSAQFRTGTELAAVCSWTDHESATRVWGALARWYAFEASGHNQHDQHAVFDRFLLSANSVLPSNPAEARRLLARTAAQRTRLDEEPECFIRVLPPQCLKSLAEQWDELSISAQCTVLERLAALNVEIPSEAVLAVCSGSDLDPEERDSLLVVVSEAVRLEILAYDALRRSGMKPPLAVVKRRLLIWPQHIRQVLTTIIVEDVERSELIDVLGLCLTEVGDSERDAEAALRAVPLECVKTALSSLEQRLKFRDISGVSRALQETAKRLGLLEHEQRVSVALDTDDAQELEAVAHGLWRARSRVETILGGLKTAGTLDDVIAEAWPRLSPDAEERRFLGEALVAPWAAELPGSIKLCEVPSVAVDTRWGAASLRFSAENLRAFHISEVRSLARTGEGALRFAALRWLHDNESPRPDELSALLADPDAEVRRQAGLLFEGEAETNPELTPELVSDVRIEEAPLRVRVAMEAPGWQRELLDALSSAEDDLFALCQLVTKKRLRSAIPVLLDVLARTSHHAASDALAELVTPGDHDIIRRLVSLGSYSVPSQALGLVTADTLDALLAREDAPNSSASTDQIPLARHLAGLGGDTMHRIRLRRTELGRLVTEALEQRARLVAAVEDRTYTVARDRDDLESKVDALRKWRFELGQALLIEATERGAGLDELVDLAFEVFDGDDHVVWSGVGPLGSDFDEPGDREWHSDLANAGTMGQFVAALRQQAGRVADAIGALSRLFSHPSETLELAALEIAIEGLESTKRAHQIPELATCALEGHLKSAKTGWSGNILGLQVALGTMQSGSVNVEPPEVSHKLLRAIRRHLTTSHRTFLISLRGNKAPSVRIAACNWIAELGGPKWSRFLEPCLSDVEPQVFRSSLLGWNRLVGKLPLTELIRADRDGWTSNHYAELFFALAREVEPEDQMFPRPKPRSPLDICAQDVLEVFAREAIEVAKVGDGATALLQKVPCVLEEVMDALLAVAADSSFLESVAQGVSVACDHLLAGALVRSLARAGLSSDRMAAICAGLDSSSSARLRTVAVEGRMLVGLAMDSKDAADRWRDEFRESRGGNTSRRFASAIEHASVEYAPALIVALDTVEFDHTGGAYADGDEEVLAAGQAAVARWGLEGQLVLAEVICTDERRCLYEHAFVLEGSGELEPEVLAQLRRASAVSDAARSIVVTVDGRDTTLHPPISERLRREILPSEWLQEGLERSRISSSPRHSG